MSAVLKTCSKCQLTLPTSSYHASARLSLGVSNWCRDCTNEYRRAWNAANKGRSAEYTRRCRERNVEAAREKDRAHYYANREARIAKSSRWNRANRERRAAAERERRQQVGHRLHGRVSAGIRSRMKTGKGGAKAESLVGWTMDELRTHLERQFLRGMSWENMGDWHIDHIVPLASFTITGPEDPELRRAWALTNLRPLWAKDNISKGDKRVTLL